jgi:hypothetical protein
MVDQTTGTIRVRVTGRSGPQVPTTATIAPDPKAPNTYVSRSAASISKWRELRWKKRSIVLEFRRKGFLDYAYFTDKEGFDPALQGATQKSVCATYYARQIPTDNKSGRYWYNGATTDSGVKRAACTEIRFADGDAINGPFHTNDSVLLASDDGATFGRAGKKDVAEVFDATCSFRLDDGLNSGADHRIPTDVTNDTNNRSGNCPPKAPAAGSVGPVINGRLVIGDDAGFLPLPETNEDLKIYGDPTNTDPDYQGLTFYGTTKIVLKNGSIDVNNDNINGGATTNYDYPTSGVIYVANSSSSAICLSNPLNAYPGGMPTGCALAEVSGTYDTPLTITSEADIVVAGNITKNASSATAVLGLIGTNFVRVRHYPPDYTGGNSSPKKCSSTGQNLNGSGTRVNNIDAAILTLQHSFIVDQYDCGIGLGTLTINGVLAQEYRGTVGTGSGTTGYAKNYVYDSRYKYLTPPHFLVPTLSTWRVSRYREQVPACACGG